ncbi:FliO/MopB family protein [Microbacterium sp.]|uniref:FliO/MopB family protein n=1 Tax=Microbacterium sp. TaxID=51671 RepID=UPI003A929F87
MDELLLLLRVAVSLAAVLGLLWFLQRRLGRRTQRSRDAEVITVLGRRGVGSKAQLVVAEAEGNRYVLGVTEHGVTVIDKLPGRRPARAVAAHTSKGETSEAELAPDFDRLFAAESMSQSSAPVQATPLPDLPLRRDRATKRADPLHGSILSPGTWRQTADFLRRPR